MEVYGNTAQQAKTILLRYYFRNLRHIIDSDEIAPDIGLPEQSMDMGM